MSPLRRILFLLFVAGALAQDASHVIFSLGTFQNISVPRNATVQAVVSKIPLGVAFITLQFHTHHRRATLSHTMVPNPSTSHTAVDSGLLSHLLGYQTSVTWYLLSPDDRPLRGTGVILPYGSSDPVPGGCSQGKHLRSDPNLRLSYNLYETTIGFAPANIGQARGAIPSVCNNTVGPGARLEYDVYRYFLPEGDLSEQTLISHMEAVANVQSMKAHGTKLVTLSWGEELSVTFGSVPGQGVIYSVLVRDPAWNTSASYIPVHTYACSFASVLDGCLTLGKISTKLFFTVAGLAGLFVCYFGHRFFKCELFWMGFVFTAFVCFVLITRTTSLDYDLRLALAAVMGVVGGVLLVMSWWRFGSVMSCVVVVGLILGFLVASVVFFTPVGDAGVFRSGTVFWVTFSSIAVVFPLIFVRWPREGNMTACGVAGAYSVVLAVNSYVGTSLSYITLDVLKRLLNNSFNRSFADLPFRDLDYILVTVWVVLGASGTILQLHRERTRPFFPPSPYLMWRQERERRKTNVLDPSHHTPSLPSRVRGRLLRLLQPREPAGELTPLLL